VATIDGDAGARFTVVRGPLPERGDAARIAVYVDRASRGDQIDLAGGVLMPSLDPIRCEPRFVAAVERMHLVDHRAAGLCTGKG
jgi:hypothetical protein